MSNMLVVRRETFVRNKTELWLDWLTFLERMNQWTQQLGQMRRMRGATGRIYGRLSWYSVATLWALDGKSICWRRREFLMERDTNPQWSLHHFLWPDLCVRNQGQDPQGNRGIPAAVQHIQRNTSDSAPIYAVGTDFKRDLCCVKHEVQNVNDNG